MSMVLDDPVGALGDGFAPTYASFAALYHLGLPEGLVLALDTPHVLHKDPLGLHHHTPTCSRAPGRVSTQAILRASALGEGSLCVRCASWRVLSFPDNVHREALAALAKSFKLTGLVPVLDVSASPVELHAQRARLCSALSYLRYSVPSGAGLDEYVAGRVTLLEDHLANVESVMRSGPARRDLHALAARKMVREDLVVDSSWATSLLAECGRPSVPSGPGWLLESLYGAWVSSSAASPSARLDLVVSVAERLPVAYRHPPQGALFRRRRRDLAGEFVREAEGLMDAYMSQAPHSVLGVLRPPVVYNTDTSERLEPLTVLEVYGTPAPLVPGSQYVPSVVVAPQVVVDYLVSLAGSALVGFKMEQVGLELDEDVLDTALRLWSPHEPLSPLRPLQGALGAARALHV